MTSRQEEISQKFLRLNDSFNKLNLDFNAIFLLVHERMNDLENKAEDLQKNISQ